MTVINTNVKSLVAQNAIAGNANKLSTAMERLSTGNRINSAKDDAAGLAISTRMNSQSRGLSVAIRNANDGISLMQTSEGALGEVTDILQRMRELAVQSVNGTNNASDRTALNDEVQQLKSEIERIATTTEFNNQKLLDGSFKGKELQIGDKAGQTLAVDIGSARLDALGLSGAGSAGGSQTLVGGRWAEASFDAGDILINGQELGAHASSTDDLEDLINNINENVDNVLASGFNELVAKNVGDGVTTDGQFDITVTALGAGNSTTYQISASDTLQELVDNINSEAGGAVSARINDDGKLVLFNTTGASITVADASSAAAAYDGGSGFTSTSSTYAGFLKLESSDGSPIRIETGETGTIADVQSLGFNAVTSDFASGDDAYTVTGKGLTTPTGAWGASDIKINGVAIYDENIATTTFAGKLEAINAFSNETGVVASGYYDEVITITETNLSSVAGALSINGVAMGTAIASGGTVATYAAVINNKTAVTGITAEVVNDGGAIRLTGYVNSVVLTGTAATVGGFTASTVDYASIRLDSVNNTPISIELGDDALVAEHGFLEANVGAADFQVNAPSLGSSSGTSLSGLDVSSLSSASSAIDSIDNAIETVGAIRSKLGAMQNRLDSTVKNLSNIVANTEASRSRIQDTDYATETTALAKAQIIQQAATAMLAQANQQPQSVLSLLQ
jgi:flagellin